MNIIQSFWSKPYLTADNTSIDNRRLGGWKDEEAFLMSWAYSCLRLKKYYPKIQLYTDDFGAGLLIDTLKLPYQKVHYDLNKLQNYPNEIWCLGKLYAYSLQTTPFLHVDGDLFIWKEFDHELLNSNLIAQHKEKNLPFYFALKLFIQKENFDLPILLKEILNNQDIYAVNAGIIGGQKLEIFHLLFKTVIDFINRNKSKLSTKTNMINPILEQVLFTHIARSKRVNINTYYNRSNLDFEECYQNFNTAPFIGQYTHLVGSTTKKNQKIIFHLKQRMKNDFPDYYNYVKDYISVKKNNNKKKTTNHEKCILTEKLLNLKDSKLDKALYGDIKKLKDAEKKLKQISQICTTKSLKLSFSLLEKGLENLLNRNFILSKKVEFVELEHNLGENILVNSIKEETLSTAKKEDSTYLLFYHENSFFCHKLDELELILLNFTQPLSGARLIDFIASENVDLDIKHVQKMIASLMIEAVQRGVLEIG